MPCLTVQLRLDLMTGPGPFSLEALWAANHAEYRVDAVCPNAGAGGVCSGGLLRQSFLEVEPPVLVANLVRNLPTGDKDRRVVLYPQRLEFLRTGRYRLRAVVTHVGRSTREGHYVSTVSSPDGRYCVFDDSMVSPPRPFEAIQKQEAYILI